jgi:hypothetical protein
MDRSSCSTCSGTWQNLVDYINQGVGGVCATVIKEIGLCDRDFTSCSIIHEGRSSNSEAHGLTKHALGLCKGHHIWLINPPFYPIYCDKHYI